MMASLLSAQATPPGRISQLLPTVKCSNCNQPVPLSELGDHVCAAPPPVPTLPKPSVSPAAATSLLPQHLQDRLVSPGPISPRTPLSDARRGTPLPRLQEPQQQRLGTPSFERLRINTAPSTSSTYQPRPSPLARTEPNRYDTSSPAVRPPTSNSTSPLRTRPLPSGDFRARTTSNTGSVSSAFTGPFSPTTARPSFSAARDPNFPYNTRPPPPAPITSEREIDTKIGGEAGMAGVGRRGFAAAARAAMFAAPSDRRPLGPPPRRDNAPYLNTDVPSRINETPPLSAGSGYSSHSPGVSPYPQSPVAQHGPSSPERYDPRVAFDPSHKTTLSMDKPGLPSSPVSLRMSFFEKSKNKLPGVIVPNTTSPIPTNNTGDLNTPSTAKQLPFPTRPRGSESASSVSSYSQGIAGRSVSMSTTASRRNPQPDRRPPSPASESGSDYGGLAYADSTDYEDDEPPAEIKSSKGKANPPPPLALSSSILRSGSIASVNHVRFPSTSVRSDRSVPPNAVGHKRDTSVSSVSSMSSAGGDSRKSSSAAIAHALGLSQTSPSSYGRLGGPGIGKGGRSVSGSSSGSRSGYSRGGPGTSGSSMGVMEKEVKTLLEGVNTATPDERRVGLTKSKSTGKQRTFGVGDGTGSEGDSGVRAPLTAVPPSTKPQRSDAVPAANGLEPRSPKASTRTKASTEKPSEAGKEKKERVRKPKVCLKCERKIMDGRWVQVDSGGVLCETCWKNMYLPKCRRCNLPIEKQAVSSADGQLKGKYHRECFNCYTCHKPFPDKSFYVFDGKPLCAYHYHEANDSLCAAARCGQPIEGPCAVSHTGDRYHPEHMTCEYPSSPPCKQRLAEYWEVDGRMLCERHAHASKVVGSDDEEGEEEWVQSSRALKRVTRFIDLAGGSGGGLR